MKLAIKWSSDNIFTLSKLINIKNIIWYELSLNPNAIELLIANPTKIDWELISRNPNAIKLLKANPTKINWDKYISSNRMIKYFSIFY